MRGSICAELVVRPVRLLTKGHAAAYCCRTISRFTVECPVRPLIMKNGDHLYDIRDLDDWIDGMKNGGQEDEAEAALSKL